MVKSSKVKNILLLDDEEMILNSMGTLLEILGYKVFKCMTGEEAISICKENLETDDKIEVAILDINIPNALGGVDCNKIIKYLDADIFSIIVTGDSTHEIFNTYREHYFDYALSKPYSLNEIKEVLENT
jgi:DNA-binding NtrC family response regulator